MEFVLPRWEQLPEMDLYLEQVLSLLAGRKTAGKTETGSDQDNGQ